MSIIIDINSIENLVTSTLGTGAQATLSNLVKHHAGQKIDSVSCPKEAFVFYYQDGSSVEVGSAELYLKFSSKSNNAIDNSKLFGYGEITKSLKFASFAVRDGVQNTPVIKKLVEAVSLADILARDIMGMFSRLSREIVEIGQLASQPTMITENYLPLAITGKLKEIGGYPVTKDDLTNFTTAQNIEKYQEKVEQIVASMSISKHIVSYQLEDGIAYFKVSNYDSSALDVINNRLVSFKLPVLQDYRITPADRTDSAVLKVDIKL